MERGQLLLGENPSAQKVDPNHGKDCGGAMGSSASSTSKGSRDLSNGSESFRRLEVGVPNTNSSQKKLSWLRSQIVGGDAEFSSPFGVRRLTYADHTASGRCLRYIENYINDNVLPFYGELECEHMSNHWGNDHFSFKVKHIYYAMRVI